MIDYCPYDCPVKVFGKTCSAKECINTDYMHIMNDPHKRPKNPNFYQGIQVSNITFDELLKQIEKNKGENIYE